MAERSSARCAVCDSPLRSVPGAASTSNSRYCSNSCRQRAYRQRVKGGGIETAGDTQLSSFVGRAVEASEVRRLLQETRVLTVTGPAGVGKSRLALDLAARERRGGQHDVALVELDGVAARKTVLRRVAAAAGGGKGAAQGRGALLVLDNCDHQLDACGTALGRALYARPGLRVLATSREPLRVQGEVVYQLAGLSLSTGAPGTDVADHLRSGAVQLFLERARAVSPNYQLTKENAALIAELCTHLDGLPLAIEMAAQLVRVFPVTEINARLDDRLSLLTGGWRTARERHRSLRAALEWSHRLLTGDEQALLRRLSVLAGGFAAEAATAVSAGSGVAAEAVPGLLASMEAKSMITSSVGQPGPGRFRLLESVRLYSHEQLRAHGEEGDTYDRATTLLAGLAEPLVQRAMILPGTVAALAQERGNLRHVLARGAGQDGDRLLLAGGLALVDVSQEREEHHHRLIPQVLSATDAAARHRDIALEGAAVLAGRRADLTEAQHLAEQAAFLARRRGSASLSRLLLLLGTVRDLSGDQMGATTSYAECLKVSRRDGDELMGAVCRSSIAWRLLEAGSTEDAERLVRESLPLLRAQASPGRLAAGLHLAGAMALERNDTVTAERCFTESLRGDALHPSLTAAAVEGLAVSAVRNSQFERALRLLGVAEVLGSSLLSVRRWWREQVAAALDAALKALSATRAEAALMSGRELRGGSVAAWLMGQDTCAQADGGPLSLREWQVVALIQEGLTNRQVADRMYLSVRTVETHMRNIRSSLGLRSRSHVAAWAAQNGLGADAVGRRLAAHGEAPTIGRADRRGVVFCTYAA